MSNKDKKQSDSGNSSDDEQQTKEASSPLTSNAVDLNEDIQIFPNSHLPGYDNGPIKAYRAVGQGQVPEKLFALICDKEFSPRTNIGANYNKIINPGLVKLIASGVVDWPLDHCQKYVLIYEDTLGKKIVDQDVGHGYGWSSDFIMSTVIRSLVGVLLDMRDKELVHGNIRPINMFNGGSQKLERVILGDCLSMPPWANMPVSLLPVDKAMASPLARGRGTPQDDLYAFGASLAVLMRANDPMAGLSNEAIIEEKIKNGSYQALTGRDRFTGAVLELLRGLLYDDPSQRWTIDEVQAWMDGRRLSPKQSIKKPIGKRPIKLANKNILSPEILALHMPNHINDSVQLVENEELDQWLQRAVENKPLRERVQASVDIASDQGKGPGFQEKLITRVCIGLNPEAPMRFKNLSILPEGIGPALSSAYYKREDIQPYVDLFNHYFIVQWVDMNLSSFIDAGALTSRFDTCRAFLRQKMIGFGLERCIYYMDPCAPCLSEKLKDYYVRTPEDIMDAYENLSSKKSRPHMFFDRHIVAFLSVKDRKNIDPYMSELSDEQVHNRILGEIRTLATIQKRSRLGKYPGMASWIADSMTPVYARIHDRFKRNELKDKVDSLKVKGDISKIAGLFEDKNLYSRDTGLFYQAIRDFMQLKEEKASLKRDIETKKTFGHQAGRQTAAVVSCIIATIVILVTTFMAVGQMFGGVG